MSFFSQLCAFGVIEEHFEMETKFTRNTQYMVTFWLDVKKTKRRNVLRHLVRTFVRWIIECDVMVMIITTCGSAKRAEGLYGVFSTTMMRNSSTARRPVTRMLSVVSRLR